ncbi:MAG: SEC-C metal-binding domain-containing protein [Candidatus Eremiobacterota bacterium]
MIDLSNLDMKDRMIIEWSLERLKYAKDINNSLYMEIEKFFTPEIITYILNECNDILKRDLFLCLPAENFSSNLNEILDKWETMDEMVMSAAYPVITSIDKEKAVKLFSSYLEKESNVSTDNFRLSGILKSLNVLDKEGGRKITELLIDSYMKSSFSDVEKTLLFPRIAGVAWKYEYHDFYNFLKNCLLIKFEEMERDYTDILAEMCELFVSSREDFELITDYIGEDSEQKYVDISMIFKDDTPVEQFDLYIEELKDEKYKNVLSFLRENLIKIDNEKVRNLLISLLDDEEIIKRFIEEEQEYLFYSFILGCFITSMRTKEVNPQNLNIEHVFDLIASDTNIDELPYIDEIADFLNGPDRGLVVKFLEDNMNLYSYGHINAIKLMGRLLYEEFLPLLVKEMSNGMHIAHEVLIKYKEKALPFIEENIKDMNKEGQFLALSVVETMKEETVIDFINKHFLSFWPCNKERLLNIMIVYPDEKFIEKLMPYAGKEQDLIDYMYLLLNRIYGIKNSDLDLMEKKYYEKHDDKRKYTEAFFGGRIEEVIKPYLDVELRCENCGDESFYRLEHITVEICCHDEPVPHIEDEITCLNCKQISSFEVTEEGKMTIMLTVFGINSCKNDEEMKRVMEKSPIKFVEHDHEHDDLDLEELEDMFLEEIEADPSDIYNYISLGNIYVDKEQFDDAEYYLRQAMEIDPEYVESYYILAYIYATYRNNYEKALSLLEKGKKYMATAKYTDDIQGHKDEFEKNYRTFYNDMIISIAHDGLEVKKIPEEKTGRNDPCPCGSGKKYKKCCMK